MQLAPIYRAPTGYLRLPLTNTAFFFRHEGKRLPESELRALYNMHEFLSSLSIICSRLQKNLSEFKADSWVGVNLSELFLDAQTYFLFVQQFLEDLALVVRLSFPPAKRAGLRPEFMKLMKRLLPEMPTDHPLKIFLNEQMEYFERLKHIRDDICHGTAFDKQRKSQFPDFVKFLSAAGGKSVFAEGRDLRGYLADSIRRVLSLACLIDDYVRENL